MLSHSAEMAPPRIAELPLKLLVPMRLSDVFNSKKIAPPPSFAEFPVKLLDPMKLSTTHNVVLIAPPEYSAEL